MLYVTGDIHGEEERFLEKSIIEKTLTEKDVFKKKGKQE